MSQKRTPAAPARCKSALRNIAGTLAIEGMSVSPETRRNLDRIASGQANSQQVLQELKEKYKKAEPQSGRR